MNDLTARIDEALKGSEGHTPGPWGYKAGFAKHYAFSLDEGEDFGISLQDMHWQDGRDVPAEQNARLIASAPTLRALLIEARAQIAAQAEALAKLRTENHNAAQALIYAIQKHPDGQVCQDWSSWRVAYGRGVYRGCGRTDTQQLISAVCMATEHADPYAPEAQS